MLVSGTLNLPEIFLKQPRWCHPIVTQLVMHLTVKSHNGGENPLGSSFFTVLDPVHVWGDHFRPLLITLISSYSLTVADDMNIKHHATCHPIKWFRVRVKQNSGRREGFTNGTKLNTNVAYLKHQNSFKIYISASHSFTKQYKTHTHTHRQDLSCKLQKKWMISKC